MSWDESIRPIREIPVALPSRDQLEYEAFHCRDLSVYRQYKRIPKEKRSLYGSKYIYASVIRGGIQALERSRGSRQLQKCLFIDGIFDQFTGYCRDLAINPRELHECMLLWIEKLLLLSRYSDVRNYMEKALEFGIRAFPELYSRWALQKAEMQLRNGKLTEARELLWDIARRFYLTPDRNHISSILFLLGQTLLLTGEAEQYRRLLFGGLWMYYSDLETRRRHTRQLVAAYGGTFRLLIDNHTSVSDKLMYIIHRADVAVRDCRFLSRIRMDIVTGMAALASAYIMNSRFDANLMRQLRSDKTAPRGTLAAIPVRKPEAGHKPRNAAILLTRAMGGLGDILMMTPGIHALKQKNPGIEIHLAIPMRFHSLFDGNPDVRLLDIESSSIDCTSYKKWFNLTNCPAAKVESRTAPA